MGRVSLLLRARLKAVELEARLIHGRRVAWYEGFLLHSTEVGLLPPRFRRQDSRSLHLGTCLVQLVVWRMFSTIRT